MGRGSAPVATFVSYRLGGTDGVSIEAAKWMEALGSSGFATRRVAGQLTGDQPGDVEVPWLALGAHAAPTPAEVDALVAILDDGDLVVVENVCSLPLEPAISRAVGTAVSRTRARVVLHHHDLPWQRPATAGVSDLPPRPVGALHVTINARSHAELRERGITAVEITNAFAVDDPPGDRAGARAAMGFAPDEIVVLQPARAIPRKNVPAAIAYVGELAALVAPRPVRFWLTGPAEDGYETELDALLAGCAVPVTVGLGPSPADAYAAADVVVFPSTVEGFGNPVIETVIARRPLVVGHYPVLDEILAQGFDFFALDEPEAVAKFLDHPDADLLDRNLAIAREHYDVHDLPRRIEAAFTEHGWARW
jgi:glycosyltransferase involved in cell wall biosynthesis